MNGLWLQGREGFRRYSSVAGIGQSPFSFRPDFLEQVCPIEDAWFGMVEAKGHICAWPLPARRRAGRWEGYMPSLCFQLGPLFLDPRSGRVLDAATLGWSAAESIGALAGVLPLKTVDATLSYHSSTDASLFAQAGFEVLSRVSHQIEDFADWKPSKQYRRVTPEKTDIRVEPSPADEDVWRLALSTFERHGTPPPYARAALEGVAGLPNATLLKGLKSDVLLAASVFGEDLERVYYLVGVQDFDHPESSAAATLVMKAGIDLAASKGLVFDFEGSMIPGVSQYFKQWGGRPTHLARIRRRSRLDGLLVAMRQALR